MNAPLSTAANAEIIAAVQALRDRLDIADLITRYGLMADEKTFDQARSIFVEDVVAEYPAGGAEGVDILAHYGNLALGGFERTQHVITNVLIELAGDTAKVRANLVATHVHLAAHPEEHFDTGCFYNFDVIRTGEGWKISRLKLTEIWTTGSRASSHADVGPTPTSTKTPRQIMLELDAELKTDPARTENVEAVYQFDVNGLNGGAYWLEAQDGTGATHEGVAENPTTIIHLSDDVFVMLATHELDGAEAFFNGQLTVDGDEGKAYFLAQIFGE